MNASIMSATGDDTVGKATQEALAVLMSPPAKSRLEAGERAVYGA